MGKRLPSRHCGLTVGSGISCNGGLFKVILIKKSSVSLAASTASDNSKCNSKFKYCSDRLSSLDGSKNTLYYRFR